ncbi:MAG: sigma D regulator, partial [Spongiibacteraceae bacterium]
MLENCDIKVRWGAVNELIESWLEERQSLIVQYCAVSGIQTARRSINPDRIQKFCQLLLDYVSAGHFEIYYELVREAEAFEDGSAEIAKTVLPQINATTQRALDFNDAYAECIEIGDPGTLAKALSQLGETFATRFDLEDQLIDALHA